MTTDDLNELLHQVDSKKHPYEDDLRTVVNILTKAGIPDQKVRVALSKFSRHSYDTPISRLAGWIRTVKPGTYVPMLREDVVEDF
jgi:hypothetical protein